MCSLIGHAPVGGGHYGTGSGLIFDIDTSIPEHLPFADLEGKPSGVTIKLGEVCFA